jgi:hypothetical protein
MNSAIARLRHMNKLARIPASKIWEQVFGANEGAIFLPQDGRFFAAAFHLPRLSRVVFLFTLFLMTGASAMAQSPTVALSIGFPTPVTTLTFDLVTGPDSSPSVAATPSSFTAQVVTTNTTTWTLQVSASDAYLDPTTRLIPIGNISWTASGTGFINGSLSVNPQTVASGSGSGTFSGTLSFDMLNRWTYPTGMYSDTITYTATAI